MGQVFPDLLLYNFNSILISSTSVNKINKNPYCQGSSCTVELPLEIEDEYDVVKVP